MVKELESEITQMDDFCEQYAVSPPLFTGGYISMAAMEKQKERE